MAVRHKETSAAVVQADGTEEVFIGGGELGALMRAFDWSRTPLGPVSGWPQSLKTALSLLLASGYPMLLAWGPHFIQFYNDAYRPVLGATKHPKGLGQSTSECFPEVWDFIGPLFQRAMTTGEATSLTDQLFLLDRNGYVEETYFTFSYSAVRQERGGVGGVFVTCIETTERVIGERRLATLRELATASAEARTTAHACTAVEQSLSHNPHDLPFTLLYLLEEDGKQSQLTCISGLERGTRASPILLDLDNREAWPLSKVLESGRACPVPDIVARFGRLPGGVWPDAPQEAMVLPIPQPGSDRLAGFLVTGISARRALDDAYRGFLDLLAGHVATALGNARAYEAERKRAEALAELDRAKTTFFSNVSHEFRTPLTLMLGLLDDALQTCTPLEGENLVVVHRNSLRLLKLVNTLLDFSRIEAGRIQASYEPTDLSAYTADLASTFRSAVERAGMRLIVDCPPLAEPVYVDREMWEKIVLNLLSNAFKFTLEGEIVVTLRQTNGRVEMAVRDTGAGIPEEQLSHIFERFHRVEGARARTHEGTGIGLALVQELVRLHGGEIRVESRYGQGTTFTVGIPRGSAHLPAERIGGGHTLASTALRAMPFLEEALQWVPDRDPATIPGNTSPAEPFPVSNAEAFATPMPQPAARILLADNNADMRQYVARLLSQWYEVEAVANGQEALGAVRRHRPDLLLSDIMMPEMDGLELLRALRADERTRTLPVILLSARAGEEARIEGIQTGADDYLVKPFSARELLARIATHLQMVQIRKQMLQEREQLIKALELERARLTELFMQAPAFIAVLRGPEHRFERVNPPYQQLTGYRELLGKTVREAFPEIEGQGFLELLDEAFHTGTPYIGKERRVLLQRERNTPLEERFVDFVYQPLIEADGSVSGIFVHGVDLTERRRAEMAVEERAKEIDALNVRLRHAMAETHQRVKNNLQVISAMIEMQMMAHRDEKTVPLEEYTQLKAHIHTLSIVHDLLTKSVKEGDDTQSISARAVLDKLLPLLQQIAWNKVVRYSIADARLTSKVCVSLALILNELVTNALKHGKNEAEVIFCTEGTQALLEVCDDGPGFPADFDPLQAANMGLELVESLVHSDLKGHALYGNRPTGGGRVLISFPLPREAE